MGDFCGDDSINFWPGEDATRYVSTFTFYKDNTANYFCQVISLSTLTLALPYTFAEAIALSLKKPGRDGFLDVQAYAGAMFVAATICCKFYDVLEWQVSNALFAALILTIKKGELYRRGKND